MITAITIIGCLTVGFIVGYLLGKRKESKEYMHGVEMGKILYTLRLGEMKRRNQQRKNNTMETLIDELIKQERSKS